MDTRDPHSSATTIDDEHMGDDDLLGYSLPH